jgi:hypothetical protein
MYARMHMYAYTTGKLNVVIFRENTEDHHVGIEFQAVPAPERTPMFLCMCMYVDIMYMFMCMITSSCAYGSENRIICIMASQVACDTDVCLSCLCNKKSKKQYPVFCFTTFAITCRNQAIVKAKPYGLMTYVMFVRS